MFLPELNVPQGSSPTMHHERSTDRIKILIVGNSFERFDAILRTLDAGGYEVLFALGRHEAIRAMRLERLDAVMCDLGLPDNAGIDLCAEVRRNAAFAHITFVFTSKSYHTRRNILEALDAGADDCFPAETDLECLIAKMAWLISHKRLEAERREVYRMQVARQMQILNIAKQASRMMASIGRQKSLDNAANVEILEIERPTELSPSLLASLADLLNDQVKDLEGRAEDDTTAAMAATTSQPAEITYTEFSM